MEIEELKKEIEWIRKNEKIVNMGMSLEIALELLTYKTQMRSPEDIENRLIELKKIDTLEPKTRSRLGKVNLGAVYGQIEMLNWVLKEVD